MAQTINIKSQELLLFFPLFVLLLFSSIRILNTRNQDHPQNIARRNNSRIIAHGCCRYWILPDCVFSVETKNSLLKRISEGQTRRPLDPSNPVPKHLGHVAYRQNDCMVAKTFKQKFSWKDSLNYRNKLNDYTDRRQKTEYCTLHESTPPPTNP